MAALFLTLDRPLAVARRLAAPDLDWAAALLAEATAAHPAVRYICAGPAAGGQRRWLAAQLLALVLRHGAAYTNAGRTALALWLGPAPPALGWALRLALLVAPWQLGRAGSQRLWQVLHTAAWLRRQSLGGPHHLLLAVAVLPRARGRGEGRRLLGATLALRQAQQPLPCYFSGHEPGQLAFYQGLGFGLTGHCAVGTGPAGPLSSWGLLRPAGAL